MAQNEKTPKGNSSDTLLSIYVLRILKKYSSSKNKLSVGDVLEYLKKEGFIGEFESEEAWRKKVRRYLDTLYESYWNGCIKKDEGKTRSGHKWFYDALKDEADAPMVQIPETLSDVELDFIIDLIAGTKILNTESTMGIIHKLLKKMSLSEEEREQRLAEIKKESWLKNPNDYLLENKEIIQGCMDSDLRIRFDYEGRTFVSVIPCGWESSDGKCILKAKIGEKKHQFFLDKIRNVDDDGYTDDEDVGCHDEEDLGANASLESLFCNIPFIKSAIKEKKEIKFSYRSFVVKNRTIVLEDHEKNVLPHSLVFNDGKYYLIGIDQGAGDADQLGYFRVDLIADLEYSKTNIKLSDWDEQVFKRIQRAREIEKHPLMLAGQEQRVEFLVRESALDRVRDAYGTSPEFSLTKDNFKQKENENSLGAEPPKENLISFTVETTYEEAFRWALANADAVELVHPQELRDRLGRIAEPIHQLYTQTLSDKVRENFDYVLTTGTFKISDTVDPDTAFETYKDLKKYNLTEKVKQIYFSRDDCEPENYLADFTNTQDIRICRAPLCKNLLWAFGFSKLRILHLKYTQVEDVSWLKDKSELAWLEIDYSPVSDLSILRDHTKIHTFRLSNTNVMDIGMIENFRRLDWLTLIDCPIKDYSPLFKIPSYLKTLEIDEKSAQLIDLEMLRERYIGIEIPSIMR